MSNHLRCEDFRMQIQEALSEEGKCFTLPEKTHALLHFHGQKCEECRKWAEEFTRIPLSREQEDFLNEVFHKERTLPPALYWSFWSLGIAGTLALLCGVFFYLEERMSTEIAPGVKVEAFANSQEMEKSAREEKIRFEQRKKRELLLEEQKKKEILPEKIEYATISFPLYLFPRNGKKEIFFKAYLGKCTIYLMEKDPAGKALLVHVPPKEAQRFLALKKRLLQERKRRK